MDIERMPGDERGARLPGETGGALAHTAPAALGHPRRSQAGCGRGAPCEEAPIWQAVLRTINDKYVVLFPRNGPQDMQLAKFLFFPRFFLTARGRHHIL